MIYQLREYDRKKLSSLAYEVCISALALIAVVTSIWDFSGNTNVEKINNIVLSIFVIDYAERFILAANKRDFVRSNILDLIAIIPFSAVFRAFRITRLPRLARLTRAIKFLRIFTFSKKFHGNAKRFLKTNGFIYMVYLTLAIIGLGAELLYILEKGHTIKTFGDAIWLSFSTATLFGYEGVENMTMGGKLIIAVLIILGISFAGMFTATVATFFMNKDKRKSDELEQKIVELSDLSSNQFNEVLSYVDYIRSK